MLVHSLRVGRLHARHSVFNFHARSTLSITCASVACTRHAAFPHMTSSLTLGLLTRKTVECHSAQQKQNSRMAGPYMQDPPVVLGHDRSLARQRLKQPLNPHSARILDHFCQRCQVHQLHILRQNLPLRPLLLDLVPPDPTLLPAYAVAGSWY